MYCSNCGVNASGRFCHDCGSRLHRSDSPSVIAGGNVEVSSDWDSETKYETIIRLDAIREVIARHAASASQGLSGEEVLALYDKIIASPIPLEHLAGVLQPLYASWGIRTGKKRSEEISVPIGRTIARTLCCFAKHGQTFLRAEQGEIGCTLTAELPSSVCALSGEFSVCLSRCDAGTHIAAVIEIPGQIFDWGKCSRCLDKFFKNLRNDMGLPPSPSARTAA